MVLAPPRGRHADGDHPRIGDQLIAEHELPAVSGQVAGYLLVPGHRGSPHPPHGGIQDGLIEIPPILVESGTHIERRQPQRQRQVDERPPQREPRDCAAPTGNDIAQTCQTHGPEQGDQRERECRRMREKRQAEAEAGNKARRRRRLEQRRLQREHDRDRGQQAADHLRRIFGNHAPTQRHADEDRQCGGESDVGIASQQIGGKSQKECRVDDVGGVGRPVVQAEEQIGREGLVGRDRRVQGAVDDVIDEHPNALVVQGDEALDAFNEIVDIVMRDRTGEAPVEERAGQSARREHQGGNEDEQGCAATALEPGKLREDGRDRLKVAYGNRFHGAHPICRNSTRYSMSVGMDDLPDFRAP